MEQGAPDPSAVHSFAHHAQSPHVLRANADIADEFMDFMFQSELGDKTLAFSRFDGPIVVRFAQSAPILAQRDLKRLVARLRNEAGINIHIGAPDTPANIYIHRMPLVKLQNIAPNAACLVVPNARDVKEFRKGWRSPESQWHNITTRKFVSVFLPSDQSPQSERDCMHEEIAQALGPLNDLFRVSNTVFNDDNMHTVLTSYDMLILRMVYSPKLQIGMTPAQVRTQLPSILKRQNPKGNGYASTPRSISLKWNAAIREGANPYIPNQRQINGARRASRMAVAENLGPARLNFSVITHARAALGRDSKARVGEYQRVLAGYHKTLGHDSIQVGKVSKELAFLLFQLGLVEEASTFIPLIKAAAAKFENAELMFEALHLQALIAHADGNSSQHKALVAQARGWGLYAFGSIATVSQIEHQIGQLAKVRKDTK
jgi:hypothetical protein